MEELLDGVEFGGCERAHRADHSAQQRAEEVPAEGHGLIADPDLDLTAVGRTWLTVHMPRIPTEDAPETLRHIKPFLASEN